MKKIRLQLAVMAVVVAVFELCVASYRIHGGMDSAAPMLVSALGALFALAYGVICICKRNRIGSIACAALLLVCLGVIFLAGEIPYCTVDCHHHTIENPVLRFFLWNRKMWSID